MLLVEFIRDVCGLKGTKVGCGEGGCGACTVDLAHVDPVSGKVVHSPINSCLRPLCSVDGCSVTTVEGIGSRKKGYHPVQSRLANCNGSQCGFCSPGWVMNMYSLLQQSPTPTSAEVEARFDGNICRCTGYRPIITAMQSFATGVSAEEAESKAAIAASDSSPLGAAAASTSAASSAGTPAPACTNLAPPPA